jgi:H+/Cl- antiporter ClcA
MLWNVGIVFLIAGAAAWVFAKLAIKNKRRRGLWRTTSYILLIAGGVLVLLAILSNPPG